MVPQLNIATSIHCFTSWCSIIDHAVPHVTRGRPKVNLTADQSHQNFESFSRHSHGQRSGNSAGGGSEVLHSRHSHQSGQPAANHTPLQEGLLMANGQRVVGDLARSARVFGGGKLLAVPSLQIDLSIG